MRDRAFSASYICSDGCAGAIALDEVVYRCPKCGGLLDVEHDVAALKTRPAAAWKRLFDERARRAAWPYASGVWGKKEWVCPDVRDENVVSLFEGWSPLVSAGAWGRAVGVDDVLVKQCGISHTGSFKDLGMTVLVSMVKEMRARGRAVRAVACASTGDTSAALAAYGAAAGIPTVVFLPRGKISTAQLVQPLAHGARVLAIDSDFDGCMALVTRACEENGFYLANSMNPLRIEGQKTVAIEIAQQLDWQVPDWVVIPGGNLGNVSALGRGFEMMLAMGLIAKRPRIAVAQAALANPLYASFLRGFADFAAMTAGETAASAIRIGNPVSARRAIRALRAFDGVVEQATEDELANAAAAADRAGLFACPHTAVALAALEKLAARSVVRKTDRVVVISTAHALKFSEFKVAYHDGRLPDVVSRHANRPIEVAARYNDVRAAALTGLE